MKIWSYDAGLISAVVKHYEKKDLWYIKMLNEKRNAKKVNKEWVKICKIYQLTKQNVY